MSRKRLIDFAAMDAADKLASALEAAWDAQTDAQRAKLARKVLALDADTLDGYVILAQSCGTLAERLALLFEAVRRGRRHWAEAIKQPKRHDFWLDIETRPFMRALHLLALALWEAGEREVAVREAEALLRLNPNDNQGICELLAVWYPATDDWPALEKLLKRYRDDGSIGLVYGAWLLAFHSGRQTEALLIDALDANPHVPTLLEKPDASMADEDEDVFAQMGFVSPGSMAEAAGYVTFSHAVWERVPTATPALIAASRTIVAE